MNDLGGLHGALLGPQPEEAATTGANDAARVSPAPGANAPGAAPASSAASDAGAARTPHVHPHFAEATPEQHEEMVRQIIAAYQQIVMRAHAAGIRVIGTTITPFGGSFYGRSPAREADRERINAWILAPGHFDATVDFAKTVADPSDPTKMAPAFDSGDHLHPSPAGYRAMGESIPLALFGGR